MAQRRCAAAPWRPAAVSHCLTVHQAPQHLPLPPLHIAFTFARRNQFYDSSCAARVFKINVSFLLPSQAVALGASLLFQTHTHREKKNTHTHTYEYWQRVCANDKVCSAAYMQYLVCNPLANAHTTRFPCNLLPIVPLWLHLCIDFCIESILTNRRIPLLFSMQCTCLDSALSCGSN